MKDDKVLDTRGKLCPMPVIEASLVMKDLISGHVLKVLATDPGSKADFPAWAEASGHRLLKQEAKDTIFTYWIQKG
ncbi:MAG: sulfurtransferase TusA family protein [Chloroflexi bacterium]|nr:sulfurtransferase TusA family protein [Chloroflexota bacterium]